MSESQISIIAEFHAKTGSENQLKQVLLEMIAPTHQEKGCINYDLHEGLRDKTLFYFYENWETEDDLKAHTRTPHYKKLGEDITGLVTENPKVFLLQMLNRKTS
ncbi:MAG: antibiotic biosynthesis monooxygenase [Pyrinomonadaceae bacterium]|nr:antibiotic biosynthesis monooxygenase [Pyrinomonadaceae bacterium]